jgi:hypothetical protein
MPTVQIADAFGFQCDSVSLELHANGSPFDGGIRTPALPKLSSYLLLLFSVSPL